MTKAKKPIKLSEEQLTKRKESIFKRKIRNTFTNAGFEYLSTMNKHFKIGHRVVELDYVFFYKNIMLICEDTCASGKDKDHIRKKKEAFDEINRNFADFLRWLIEMFPDKTLSFQDYREERIQTFYLYISQNELDLTEDEQAMYTNIRFIEPQTLNYFHWISQCIRLSSRYEIFRFLNIKNEQIGFKSSDNGITKITAPIIYPKDFTGLYNGVRVVSFMMSAEKLLSTCYVMRKDNWEDSVWLYKRLIEKDKIKKIRLFLAGKGEAFYNNIIVALPDNISFVDLTDNHRSINDLSDMENCRLEIPDEMNSICVIDGQHRIFAHYEAPESDKQEKRIAALRKQLHLLVTGLVFPREMKQIDRIQIQSEIFLDINSNAKPVPANVLLHIEMIKNPFSNIGLARRVIEKLNKQRTFLNKFELSSLDDTKIKVASIIKFALRYLVTLEPSDNKVSMYAYWDGDKEALAKKDEHALDDYISFCSKKLDLYFSAIRDAFRTDWYDPNSKILSVISINGFIIAYNKHLTRYGINNDFEFYNKRFRNFSIDFSKDQFPYTSSQYHKFSSQILEEVFDLDDSEIISL